MVAISISVSESGKGASKWDLESDLTGKETLKDFLDFTKTAHVKIAKTALKDEQSRGFDKKARVRTDNVFERNEYQVRYFGKIEYFARVDISFALIKMYEALIERSPISTGQYRSANLVFVNGIEVARGVGGLKRYIVIKSKSGGFKPTDTIRFVNAMPYARRLEHKGIRRGVRGKYANKNQAAGGRTRKSRTTGNPIKQPNGAYYLSYRVFRSKYKQIASFMRFSFMPNGSNGIYIKASGKFRNTFKKDGRPYLYPTIILKLSGEGMAWVVNM